MQILILVPIWGRPKITRIFAYSLDCFVTSNMRVLCILSEEDSYYTENYDIINEYEFNVCTYKNKPLGQKMNAGIEAALTFEWDYIMNLGSDDIIHPALMQLYYPTMEDGKLFFGLDRVYFYQMSTCKLAVSVPYTWGACRMISRSIIEKVKSASKNIYTDNISRGLDCDSMHNITECTGIKYEAVKTEGFPFLIDLKTWDNINDYVMMSRFYTEVDVDILTRYFPKHITMHL